MIKRIVSLLFLFMIIAFAGALIIPNFVDWNKHKDKVVSVISSYTSADMEVAGKVYFKVLPSPEIVLGSVKISGGVISAREIGAKIKLIPLLEGKIEFDSLNIVDPIIDLKINKKGKKNWDKIISSKNKRKKSVRPSSISLNNVTIKNGIIKYFNKKNNNSLTFKRINLDISADTILGPYKINGSVYNRGTEFDVDIKSKKYDRKTPISFMALFKSEKNKKNLPDLKLNGVLDLSKNFDIQGELTIENGSLYNLIGDSSLNNIRVLKEKIKLRSLVEINKKKIAFNGISLKADKKKTALKGKGKISFYPTKKTSISFDLEGNDITITNREFSQYINTPKSFNGAIKFKGRNIVISGRNIGYINTSIKFNSKKWTVNPSTFYFKGKTKIDVSGKISPNLNTADYKINGSTEDFNKFIGSLPMADNNILKAIADKKSLKDLTFKGRISLSPKKIILYNMKTKINKSTAIGGIINIDRKKKLSNFNAKLHLPKINMKNINKDLTRIIMKSDSVIELKIDKATMKEVTLNNVVLKGSISNNRLNIKQLKADLNKDRIAISGFVESMYPTSFVNLKYSSKLGGVRNVAKLFGMGSPPLLFKNITKKGLSGNVKGNSKKYSFDFESFDKNNGLEIKGTKIKDEYVATIKIVSKNTSSVLKEINLPIDKIINSTGPLQFNGDFKGTNSNYKISNVDAKIGDRKISGSLSKNNSVNNADIKIDNIDINEALNANFNLDKDYTLNISGANSWGGDLKAKLFSNKITGKISNINLTSIVKKLNIKNINLSKGNLEFDLTSSKEGHLTGDIIISSPKLVIKGLNYTKLGRVLNDMETPPIDLSRIIKDTLSRKTISFKDVVLGLNIDKQSMVSVNNTKLANNIGDLEIVAAVGNLKKKSYNIETKLHIKKPKTIPAFKISKMSAKKGYKIDLNVLKKFIKKNNPLPIMVQPAVEAIAPASKALPPQEPDKRAIVKDNSPISGILDRLDEK